VACLASYLITAGAERPVTGISRRKQTSATLWSPSTTARTTRCLCSGYWCTWGKDLMLLYFCYITLAFIIEVIKDIFHCIAVNITTFEVSSWLDVLLDTVSESYWI